MNIVNVGFIGLGNVGSKLARNILKGNFHLFVNDLNKNKSKNLIYEGAKWCATLENLASKSTIIITCLPSPKVVNEVLTNLLPFFNKNVLCRIFIYFYLEHSIPRNNCRFFIRARVRLL